MARLMMDNCAIPMSCFSSSPYGAYQAPYYVIPQPAHTIPQYSAPTQYVYNPSSASDHGQSNGAPIFKMVPSLTHQHPYPLHNVVPADMSKKEITLQEALENVLRQHKQPKAPMVQQAPQSYVAPNARHPVYIDPEETTSRQPALQNNGYPVYRAEDVGDANRSHLQFGVLGNQQPSGVQYVNGHGIPITDHSPVVAVGESQPYGLPAAQPGMRWKLVPVEDNLEETRGAIPIASPKLSSAGPVLMLKSPESDCSSDINGSPASTHVRDGALSAQSHDRYKQFLPHLFSKSEEKLPMKASDDSEGRSKVASATSANSVVPQMEVKGAATSKSVRIIPVTDAPNDNERVVLEGEGFLKEKDCSETNAKAGPSSVKKPLNKASPPTLKPIRLVPSLDFVKKKESKHVAGSKQEKQVNPQNGQGKVESHEVSAENRVREEEVQAETNAEKVAALKTPEESCLKMEVAAKRAREKSVEGSSGVESHTVQLEKGDEPSAKKKKLITDSETAVRLLQSVYRGYVVRRCQPLKHLRAIARVKSMLKEYQALASDRSSLQEKCKDPAERTKISEGIMSLLLQLDVIQGVDPVVRGIRKFTSKEVLKLQSEVDAAMALISISPEIVNQVISLSLSSDETKTVDKELARSEVPNPTKANENVEHHHDIATTDHEKSVSKSEDIATENEPIVRPVGQPEEQLEDLLRKLLNKLPETGGFEGTEAADAGKYSDADDSALISEVAKRLAFLKEQQRNKNSDTRWLNEEKNSADSFSYSHIERQEEATVLDMRASEDSSDEVLQSVSTSHEDLRQSTTADDAASHSIFEPTISIDSALEGEGSLVVREVEAEREEYKIPISEPATSPSELELQHLVETVAADFVDEVLTYTQDLSGSVESVADNKENISPEGQDSLGSYDTILHEGSVGLPTQSVTVDDFNGMTGSPKLVNIQLELEETSHLKPTEIASGETQTETSVTNSAVIDGEDTTGILQSFEVDNNRECPIVPNENRQDDEEGPQRLYRNARGTDNQSISLIDTTVSGCGDVLRQDITGYDKEELSELGTQEECSCKGFAIVSIEAANAEATNCDSTKSLADEEEVQHIDFRDDAVLKQNATKDVAYETARQATLLTHNEDTVNEDSVKVKVEKVNLLEETSSLILADCKADNTTGLWNGFDSTCQGSIDVESTFPSIVQDSEEVAVEFAYLGVGEPRNYDQNSRTLNGSDKSVTPENGDFVETMNVQIPNKNLPPQESRVDIDSPTSVLDAVLSVAPAEDVASVAEIILDDSTSEEVSIQAGTMAKFEGLNVEQSQRDSSVYEEEVSQLQSAISDLQSLNNEGESFLNDETLQLQSAISNLHSLNNTGQGFLNYLNPVDDLGNVANSVVRGPSLKKITEGEVYLSKPPSLSPQALHILEGEVSPGDVYERLCPSSVSTPCSETDVTLTRHLIQENMVLKELVKDVLKWSQWQNSATLNLHKMMEKLAFEVLETKATAKRAVKCKQTRNKKAAKRKTR